MKYRVIYFNKILELEAEDSTLVLDFRLKIEKHLGLLENSTMLFCNGALEDDKYLGQAEKKPEASIIVYSKPINNNASLDQYQNQSLRQNPFLNSNNPLYYPSEQIMCNIMNSSHIKPDPPHNATTSYNHTANVYQNIPNTSNFTQYTNIKCESVFDSISSYNNTANNYSDIPSANNFMEDTKDIKPSRKSKPESKFHLGKIPGVPVGTCWEKRREVADAIVHRPHVAGISGNKNEGSESIVLAGGYIDDEDYGDEFLYTGSGGITAPIKGYNIKEDQELKGYNYTLALNCDAPVNNVAGAQAQDWTKSKPVRVIRSYKLKKYHPRFAPESGNRYDGLYKLVRYYPEKSKHRNGSLVWRFHYRRDDMEPAPWTPEGIKRCNELGLGYNFENKIFTQSNLYANNSNQDCNDGNIQNSDENRNNGINTNSNIDSENPNVGLNPSEVAQPAFNDKQKNSKNQKRRNWEAFYDKMFGEETNSNFKSFKLPEATTSNNSSIITNTSSKYETADDIQDIILADF